MCVYITLDRVYINSTVTHKNSGDIAKMFYLVTITEVNLTSVWQTPPTETINSNLLSVADLKGEHKAPLPKFSNLIFFSVNISFPYLVLLLYINADIFCPYFT